MKRIIMSIGLLLSFEASYAMEYGQYPSGTLMLPSRGYLEDQLRKHGYHEHFIGTIGLHRTLGSVICTPEHVYDVVTEGLDGYGYGLKKAGSVQSEVASLYRPDVLKVLLSLHPNALRHLHEKGLLE